MLVIARSQTSDTWSATPKSGRSNEICKIGWRNYPLLCDRAQKCRPS